MQHMCRAHLGQQLTAEAVAQLRALDRGACQICASIQKRTNPRCDRCGVATPTRALVLGNCIPDTRRARGSSRSNLKEPQSLLVCEKAPEVAKRGTLLRSPSLRRVCQGLALLPGQFGQLLSANAPWVLLLSCSVRRRFPCRARLPRVMRLLGRNRWREP